jgi:uncharacterized membrane protein YfcA
MMVGTAVTISLAGLYAHEKSTAWFRIAVVAFLIAIAGLVAYAVWQRNSQTVKSEPKSCGFSMAALIAGSTAA